MQTKNTRKSKQRKNAEKNADLQKKKATQTSNEYTIAKTAKPK
jgi:hypothetical protein